MSEDLALDKLELSGLVDGNEEPINVRKVEILDEETCGRLCAGEKQKFY
jgi:hypothetical protein